MIELPGFSKEDKIIFGLKIIELERKYKDKDSSKVTNLFLKTKEKLKKERLDFLKSLEK